MKYPRRIVCLTEEAAETLYLLGEEERIVGVSAFAERPEAIKSKKRVCAFTTANLKRILEVEPDLVIGYSDIQKDIAKELIEAGLNVWIANHRTLADTLSYIEMLGRLVNRQREASSLVSDFEAKMNRARERAAKRYCWPRVYLEEWPEPMISGIRYFSELVELCGAKNIFSDRAAGFLARERFVSSAEVIERAPELILASWCGKPVELAHFKTRAGWDEIPAVASGKIVELPSSVILQPGPALFLEGIDLVEAALADF